MSGPAGDLARRKHGWALPLAADSVLPKASHDDLARQRLRHDLQQLMQREFTQ